MYDFTDYGEYGKQFEDVRLYCPACSSSDLSYYERVAPPIGCNACGQMFSRNEGKTEPFKPELKADDTKSIAIRLFIILMAIIFTPWMLAFPGVGWLACFLIWLNICRAINKGYI